MWSYGTWKTLTDGNMRKPEWNHEQKGCQPSWLMLIDVGRSLICWYFVPIDRDRVVVLARDACILGYIRCWCRRERRSRSATPTVRASTATAIVYRSWAFARLSSHFIQRSCNASQFPQPTHAKENTKEQSHKNTLGKEVLNITPILPSFAAINPDFRCATPEVPAPPHSLFRWSTMTLPPELVKIIVEPLTLVPLFRLRRTCRREDGWISTTTAILRFWKHQHFFLKPTNTAAVFWYKHVQTVSNRVIES